MTTVGLVHPGQMGASIGGALRERGVAVVWASQGRSPQSSARAIDAGLTDVGTLAALATKADIVVSICPPDAALETARSVTAAGFTGTYLDANAVSPATAAEIATVVGSGFVDGDIIGGPARPGGTTRLYLSGARAAEVAALFAGSDQVSTQVLDGPPNAASSLKMCYAAWTKGTAALLIAIRSAAATLGVEDALLAEWARSQPDLTARSEGAASTAPKAWRFVGEMEEIAHSFRDAGLPDGFARAAAEIYQRLAPFKDRSPTLPEVLAAIR
jgi:3-hydroxyisobutyrate dehydrogenase-like beta-hydroxyacid dehydrogenase